MMSASEAPAPAQIPKPGMLGRKLTPAEVAVLETFVVPRYLEKFGEALLNMLLIGGPARVAHFGCRTGYLDREVIEMGEESTLVGLDSSLAALELARNKALSLREGSVEYQHATRFPTELEPATFSHAMTLHPMGGERERLDLFREMERVLYSGGQALVSLPFRGSFQEIGDLFREYALKSDHGEFGKGMELAMLGRPTPESLSDELEAVGFDDIDVEARTMNLSFENARYVIDDPILRLFVLPDFQALTGVDDFREPMQYLTEAVSKYWSNRDFQLSVTIGTASARKV